ncbi:MAG: D-2-hydroxyacid dehydrogenase [Cytophagales bacterium]|nr:D-2-hydroxyacid dehydrogenase [Armatimonadota bacterium]
MKIVVLDALPLDADHDLDWSPLRAIGDVTLHERTAPDETASRIAAATVIYTNKVRLGAAEMDAAGPGLKFIGVLATGYDGVDVASARQRGITVCNVPGYSAAFTAQTTIALLLELCQHVGAHSAAVRAGEWQRRGIWSFWDTPLIELSGKTLVVVGLGAVGGRVAKIAEALGMTVLSAQLPHRPAREAGSSGAWLRLPLSEALSQADAVSLHCPLTPETRGLVNAERLAQLKSSALLVNAARGPVVDDHAVAGALHSGHLAGFAADVLFPEPPDGENPLLTAPNTLLTPHLGWASRPARERLLAISAANLRGFQDGLPQNVVA